MDRIAKSESVVKHGISQSRLLFQLNSVFFGDKGESLGRIWGCCQHFQMTSVLEVIGCIANSVNSTGNAWMHEVTCSLNVKERGQHCVAGALYR